MSWDRRRLDAWMIPAVIIILGIAGGALYLNDNLSLLGDDAQFLIFARQIATGQPLARAFFIGAPPVAPGDLDHRAFYWLLAALTEIFGSRLLVLKAILLVLGLSGLYLWTRLFKPKLDTIALWGTVLFCLASLWWWRYNTLIVTEPVYILLSGLSLTLFHWALKENRVRVLLMVAAVTAIAATTLVRFTGLALLVALPFYLYNRRRGIKTLSLAKVMLLLLAGAFLFFMLGHIIHDGVASLEEVNWWYPWRNLVLYVFFGFSLVSAGITPDRLHAAVFFGMLALPFVLRGISRAWDDPEPKDYYFLIYMVGVIFTPLSDERYLVPVLPLIFYYWFLGMKGGWSWLGNKGWNFGALRIYLILILNLFIWTMLTFGCESFWDWWVGKNPQGTLVAGRMLIFFLLLLDAYLLLTRKSWSQTAPVKIIGRAALPLLLILCLAANLFFTLKPPYGPQDDGMRTLAREAKRLLPPSARIMAAEPPLVYYFLERPLTPTYPHADSRRVLAALLKAKPDYLLIYRGFSGDPDGLYLLSALEPFVKFLTPIHQAENAAILKIEPAFFAAVRQAYPNL